MLCTETFKSTPRSTVLTQQPSVLTLFWHGRVLFAATHSKASVAEDHEEVPCLLFSLSLSLALLSNLQHSSHRNSDLNNSISFLGISFRHSFSPDYFLLTVNIHSVPLHLLLYWSPNDLLHRFLSSFLFIAWWIRSTLMMCWFVLLCNFQFLLRLNAWNVWND